MVKKKKRHGVSLRQYRKVKDRWQWVQTAQKNGKPDPKYVHVEGKLVPSKGGGTFYIDYRDAAGVRHSRAVGTDPTEALDAWKLQMGIKRGDIEPDPEEEKSEKNKGKTIDQAIKDYLVEVEATKGKRTLTQYTRDLVWFRSICQKTYVSELDRSDAIALFAAGRKAVDEDTGKPLNQKTINRRVIIMLSGMRNQGAVIVMKKGDWPKTITKRVEIYQPEELPPFFAACTPKERLVFQVFLNTGFREGEVRFLTWPDLDPRTCQISVSAKPSRGFLPKSYEERSVRVPRKLVDELLAYRRTAKTLHLMFPTEAHPTRKKFEGGKPDGDLLSMCKNVAFRAGLNCGRCEGTHTVYVMRDRVNRKVKRPYTCGAGPYCSNWYLHKFRHTFATNMVHDGVDIRTLQVLLGHKNIATTQIYLQSLRLDKLADLVEGGTLAKLI